jgi:hypothetical protein
MENWTTSTHVSQSLRRQSYIHELEEEAVGRVDKACRDYLGDAISLKIAAQISFH